jgi:hypothetical protein
MLNIKWNTTMQGEGEGDLCGHLMSTRMITLTMPKIFTITSKIMKQMATCMSGFASLIIQHYTKYDIWCDLLFGFTRSYIFLQLK